MIRCSTSPWPWPAGDVIAMATASAAGSPRCVVNLRCAVTAPNAAHSAHAHRSAARLLIVVPMQASSPGASRDDVSVSMEHRLAAIAPVLNTSRNCPPASASRPRSRATRRRQAGREPPPRAGRRRRGGHAARRARAAALAVMSRKAMAASFAATIVAGTRPRRCDRTGTPVWSATRVRATCRQVVRGRSRGCQDSFRAMIITERSPSCAPSPPELPPPSWLRLSASRVCPGAGAMAASRRTSRPRQQKRPIGHQATSPTDGPSSAGRTVTAPPRSRPDTWLGCRRSDDDGHRDRHLLGGDAELPGASCRKRTTSSSPVDTSRLERRDRPVHLRSALDPGTYTVQVWRPDDSDGKSDEGPYRNLVETTVTSGRRTRRHRQAQRPSLWASRASATALPWTSAARMGPDARHGPRPVSAR